MELPISTWKVARGNLSVGGGVVLRPLPFPYIDLYQPDIPLSLQCTVRRTWRTSRMEGKLQRLLNQFQFAPGRETHQGALEGKGYPPRESTFQMEEAVAQVAE